MSDKQVAIVGRIFIYAILIAACAVTLLVSWGW